MNIIDKKNDTSFEKEQKKIKEQMYEVLVTKLQNQEWSKEKEKTQMEY